MEIAGSEFRGFPRYPDRLARPDYRQEAAAATSHVAGGG